MLKTSSSSERIRTKLPGSPWRAAAADQLPIDAGRVVQFRANHTQAPEFRDAFAQFNIGPPAGHVGRHRHSSRLTGPGDDVGLGFQMLRVQEGKFDPRFP